MTSTAKNLAISKIKLLSSFSSVEISATSEDALAMSKLWKGFKQLAMIYIIDNSVLK